MKARFFLWSIALVALAGCANGRGGAEAGSGDGAGSASEEQTAVAEARPAVEVLGEGEPLPRATDRPLVIDFNATWCGPCRQFAPVFADAAERLRGRATFLSVDVDRHPEIAHDFGVASIPTVVIVGTDGTVDTYVGYLSSEEFLAILGRRIK